MLEQIHIQNIGLVEDISMDFHKGITMFSGETGAGKSMLLSSLLLLMGEKADVNTVRSGTNQANISAVWNIAGNEELHHWLREKGIDYHGDELQTRRTIKSNGRSQCFVEGTPTTLKEMRECMDFMCEIHIQHEHQKLFNSATQLKIIDRFAGISARVEVFATNLNAYKKKEKLFLQSVQDEQTRLREIDYLEFAVQEIEVSKVKKNEDDVLAEELHRASHAEHMLGLWKKLDGVLLGEQGALDMLKDASRILNDLDELQPNLSALNMRLNSTHIEIDDIVNSLKQEEEKLVFLDPEEIQKLEHRLGLLEGLKKKYGGTLEQVLKFEAQSREKLDILKNYDQDKSKIEEELKVEKAALIKEALEISDIRRREADTFSQEVNQVLHKLAMDKANFYVNFNENKSVTAQGMDNIEFYISSNKGEKHYPLAKIASGGEMSRIMLAIKVISSKKESLATLVLDEVDAGIGGNTARVLGKYLHQLGVTTQVICVSHVPVIVAAADLHYKVDKQENDERTVITISPLHENTRILELARMISGQEKEEIAQKQAVEFIKLYH